jgi:hypothetical protein
MTVAAGIELQMKLLAARAPIQMTAQIPSATLAYRMQRARVPTRMRYFMQLFYF